jgi:DNA-binding LacI/PurR family transcriptional regulator
MPNIKMIASLANVSPGTVSNVFTHKRAVSEAKRNRVLEVCKKLNYMPSVLASSMITKQTNFLGFFLKTNDGTYDNLESDMIRGASMAALKHFKNIILYPDFLDIYDPNTVLRTGCQPIDGAIITLPKLNDKRIDVFSTNTIPYVIIGTPFQKNTHPYYIDIDNENISYKLTEHLIKNGHKSIVMINYEKGFTVTKLRNDGYVKAYADANLPLNQKLIFNVGISERDGAACIDKLIRTKTFFSAVIVSMSNVAKGVYKTLKNYNLIVGEDISVASFNLDFFELSPPLTTSVVDYCKIGETAVDLLQSIIKSEEVITTGVIQENSFDFTESCQPFNPKLYEKFCLL